MKAVAFFILTVITFATALPHPEPAYIEYGALSKDANSKASKGEGQANAYDRGCSAIDHCRHN